MLSRDDVQCKYIAIGVEHHYLVCGYISNLCFSLILTQNIIKLKMMYIVNVVLSRTSRSLHIEFTLVLHIQCCIYCCLSLDQHSKCFLLHQSWLLVSSRCLISFRVDFVRMCSGHDGKDRVVTRHIFTRTLVELYSICTRLCYHFLVYW